MEPWYTIRNIDTVDTPALIIYPDNVSKNIAVLRSFVSDMARVRPHIKTNKCPQVARMMMEAGIHKFKCATIAEAEMLAMEGAKDVLLAYQPVGPKAKRFCELQAKYPRTIFSCLIDNADSLKDLSASATDNNTTIRVFIDLNVGMNRTGIRPGKEAFRLFTEAASSRGIGFLGLHVYDGHIRDADLEARARICDEAFRPVAALREEIIAAGAKDPVLIAGGTPTFPIHARRKDVEVSPGTFIFWDRGYQQILAEQPFSYGALVVTRVISTPDEYTLCLDLGHKAIAAENEITRRVFLLNAEGLTPIGHSEEHMVFRSETKHHYRPGQVFYGVPYHICPTVALYEEAGVCRDHVVSETWPIMSRKRKITV
jgi:D-serine deaminase-like pyridoxal phosphate-dependent protein